MEVCRRNEVCLSQIRIEQALAGNHVENEGYADKSTYCHSVGMARLTEENTGDDRMCIVPRRVLHVAETQHTQLQDPTATCSIDGEQDWPCNQASGKASRAHDSQEAQKEVTVDRGMIQNMGVGYPEECSEPIEESRRKLRASLTTATIRTSAPHESSGDTY